MRVGFIGLGQLGKTMARRLLAQGVELTVWNRTRNKENDLLAARAESPRDLISRTDVVFLSLFDSKAVADVLTGPGGLLAGDCRGKIIIDTTTNHYEPVVKFHGVAREHGASYLESPVLGSVVPASRGELTVLVSGEKKTFDDARPLIEHLGKRIFFLEKPGFATRMKLVNNLVLGTFMAVLAEALVFGEKTGLERSTVLDILASGAGASGVLNAKREKLTTEDFSPHFSAALIHKDLGYLEELASELGYPSSLAPVVRRMFERSFSRNLQNQDLSIVYKTLTAQE